jgi:hypothetical protein
MLYRTSTYIAWVADGSVFPSRRCVFCSVHVHEAHKSCLTLSQRPRSAIAKPIDIGWYHDISCRLTWIPYTGSSTDMNIIHGSVDRCWCYTWARRLMLMLYMGPSTDVDNIHGSVDWYDIIHGSVDWYDIIPGPVDWYDIQHGPVDWCVSIALMHQISILDIDVKSIHTYHISHYHSTLSV